MMPCQSLAAKAMSDAGRGPKGPQNRKPYLLWFITLLGLLLAIVAHSVFGASEVGPATARVSAGPERSGAPGQGKPPARLESELEALAQGLPGRNSVMVRSIEGNWMAGYRGATVFPQGTLRRIWLGAALLDAIDHGELSLDQHVPLRRMGAERSGRTEQVRQLLQQAVVANDREAQDQLLDGLNGSDGMAAWLEEHAFGEVAFGSAYRDMAGRTSRPDGATSDGAAFALGEILAGRVLQENSTRVLLACFSNNVPQPGIGRSGWQVLQMSGMAMDGRTLVSAGAFALVKSRSGERYAVAVFVAGGKDQFVRRDRLLAASILALQRRAGH